MFFNDYYNSPIGNITMASDGESLCGLWFDGQKYFASTVKGETAKIMAKQRGISRMSAQAVGGAVGHNPVSIIVPCHRVVGTNGNLTGYAGGIDKKISLLKIEKTDVKKLIQKFPKRIN